MVGLGSGLAKLELDPITEIEGPTQKKYHRVLSPYLKYFTLFVQFHFALSDFALFVNDVKTKLFCSKTIICPYFFIKKGKKTNILYK